MKKFFKYNRGAAIGALVLIIILSVFLGVNRTVLSYKNKVMDKFSASGASVASDLQSYLDFAKQLSAVAKANGCNTAQLDTELAKIVTNNPFSGADEALDRANSAANVVFAELSAKTNIDEQQKRTAISCNAEMYSVISRIQNNDDYNKAAKKYNKAANAFPASVIAVFTDTTDDAAVFKK